ncbi:MAG TPA: ribosome-associated translation inhibitor RaiA [Gemmataceae bacterium]
MQVKISARHGHLSDSAQETIRDKAQKLLHYFERLTFIEVTVDLQEDAKTVEVLATAEHKHEFVARETNGEAQVALDMALDKVVHQLRRYKEKIQDHRRTPPAGGGDAGHPRGGPAPAAGRP